MAPVFRKFTKRVFVLITVVLCGIFLLACSNAFLSPEYFWFISIIGLAFPFLLALVLIALIFWTLFRSRWILLPLACLLIGYTNIRALIAFNFKKENSAEKKEGALRVMSWNVSWFDEQAKPGKHHITSRKQMFEFIREMDPDVLCFQEYVEPNTRFRTYNNFRDITSMGYPYSTVATDYTGWKNTWQTGIAIFSKYPIVDSLRTRYPGPKSFRAGESLIAVDIRTGDDTIRVFTTHLQSFRFQQDDYRRLEIIKSASDSMLEASMSVVKKLAQGYRFRGQQVDIVKRFLDESPYPTILCGDFNDIPNSYTYFKLSSGRQDAFIEAGKGIGRTFANISPTLRIDYILAGEAFEVQQYLKYTLPYSEHYPILADLKLKDTED